MMTSMAAHRKVTTLNLIGIESRRDPPGPPTSRRGTIPPEVNNTSWFDRYILRGPEIPPVMPSPSVSVGSYLDV